MKLAMEHLSKQFKNKIAVKQIDTILTEGVYGFLGANGAGKTTLFNCISGEMDFDSGKIYMTDEENSESMNYEKIGYVYSTPILPEFLTGYEFIRFFTDINKKKIKNIKTPEEYADMVCFDRSDLDKLIKGYSHGMKNKMQMLATVIASPEVMLLDEPLTSLDVVAAHEMKEMLMNMKKDHIIILSTHILQLAKDLCDEIVLLHGGRLAGVADDVYHSADFEEKLIQMLSAEREADAGDIEALNAAAYTGSLSNENTGTEENADVADGRAADGDNMSDARTLNTDYDPYDYD